MPSLLRAPSHPSAPRSLLACVGLLLALGLAGCGGDDNTAEDPAASGSSGSAAPPDCPPAPKEESDPDPIDEPDASAPDAVPDDPTSVRLCQGLGTEVEGADTLVTDGAADLAVTVNDLERTDEPQICTQDIGPGFRLVFGYADGSTFTVSGKTYGCRELVVGSGYRTPATKALKEFQELAG